MKEKEIPIPAKNELLIRIHATTVNRTDCGILWANPPLIRLFTGLFKPKHQTPGTDFSGVVEQVGSEVADFKPGDRVWGLFDEGLQSQAEYMTISTKRAIARIPDHISFELAAASGEGAHYAYNMIIKADLNKVKRALVYGATGAIGSAAVQLLRHFNIPVTAVGNERNRDMVNGLGAEKVYAYDTEDFTQDEHQYDLILDAVGKSSFDVCKPLLTPTGIYMSSELGPGAENLYLPLTTKLKGKKRVIFPVPSNCNRSVKLITELLNNNEFRPVIDKIYSAQQIKEAYEYVNSGQKTGNVIVNFAEKTS